MTSERLIKSILSQINSEWLSNVKDAFNFSPFKIGDRLINTEFVPQQLTFEKLDKNGKLHFDKTINLTNQDEVFDLTFKEFAISNVHYYESIDALYKYQKKTINKYDFTQKKQRDIEYFAKLLSDKLIEFGNNNINIGDFSLFKESAFGTIEEYWKEQEGTELEQFKNDFYLLLYLQIEDYFDAKIEGEFYNPNASSLNFKLNLEDLTSLLAILFNSKIIEDENSLLKFALKNFKIYNPITKAYDPLVYGTFKPRFKKQFNRTHRTTGIENIISILTKSSEDLQFNKSLLPDSFK